MIQLLCFGCSRSRGTFAEMRRIAILAFLSAFIVVSARRVDAGVTATLTSPSQAHLLAKNSNIWRVANEARDKAADEVIEILAKSTDGKRLLWNNQVLASFDATGKINQQFAMYSADVMTEVGERINAPSLVALSSELEEATRTVLLATDQSTSPTRVVPAELRKAESAFDAVAAGLLLDLSTQSRAVSAATSREALIAIIKQVFDLASRAESQAHNDELRLLPMSAMQSLSQVSLRTVAIVVKEPPNDPVVIGTGVLLRSKSGNPVVVTAAHVLTRPALFSDQQLKGKPISELVTIRMALQDESLAFTNNAPSLKVTKESIEIRPELDVAIIPIEVPADPKTSELLNRALGSPIQFASNLSEANIGVVCGFAAKDQTRDREQLTWIPFGRIVFPAIINRPLNGLFLDPTLRLDPDYCRAIRQQLIAGKLLDLLDEKQLQDAINQVWDSYSDCGEGRACRLRSSVDDLNLRTYMAGQAVTIACFGTDLPTKKGCSGGPLYLLTTPPKLVGIVSGVASSVETSTPELRSLNNFSRAVPWPLIQGVMP